MSKIDKMFIIGNGFDLAHNLPTSYDNFKNWLIYDYLSSEYEESYSFALPHPNMGHDGDESISYDDKARFILHCIEYLSGGDWCDFENQLGLIDWDIFLDEAEDVFDKEGDLHYSYTRDNREAQSAALHLNAESFTELFSIWINSIAITDEIEKKKFLNEAMQESSVFMTFNYTRTLEDVYKIDSERIFHIHGTQDSEIIIGHGSAKLDIDFEDEYDWFANYHTIVSRQIQDLLRKPTQDIISKTSFFIDLSKMDIKNIYSWGFSFSDVDLCYIKEICNRLDTRTIEWHLNDFGDWQKNIPILRECGFKGTTKSFT